MQKPMSLMEKLSYLDKKVQGLEEKVQGLEKATATGSTALTGLSTRTQNSFDLLRNIVDGVVLTVAEADPEFQNKLNKTLEGLAFQRLLAQQEEQKKQLEGMVTNGLIAPSETVTEVALVIAEVTDSEKSVVSPRSAFSLDSKEVPEWLKTLLLGKKVGDQVQTEQGETLTVVEVYLPVLEAKPTTLVEVPETPSLTVVPNETE